MNRELSFDFPVLTVRADDFPERQTYDGVRKSLEAIRKMHLEFVKAFNHNNIEPIAQAVQPTPEEDRILLWEDTDAATGQPTHYLVVNTSGTVVTFASGETAP